MLSAKFLPVTALCIAASASIGRGQTTSDPAEIPPTTAPESGQPLATEAGASLKLRVAPYAWLASTSGDVTVQAVAVDATASFSDILDTQDNILAFMGALDGQVGRFVFQFNAAYIDLGFDKQPATANGEQLNAKLDYTSAWYELFGGYRFIDQQVGPDASAERRMSLDGFIGGRVTSIKADGDFTAVTNVTLPDGTVVGPGTSAQRSGSADWIEPFVGARFAVDLTEHWSLSLRGDVGGFGVDGADFAWQAIALAGYRWRFQGWDLTAFAGYRALSQDYSSGSFAWDVITHGPMLGAAASFAF